MAITFKQLEPGDEGLLERVAGDVFDADIDFERPTLTLATSFYASLDTKPDPAVVYSFGL